MLMEIRDNVIWAKHLQTDTRLQTAVLRLKDDQKIKLSVDGILAIGSRCVWAKMADQCRASSHLVR